MMNLGRLGGGFCIYGRPVRTTGGVALVRVTLFYYLFSVVLSAEFILGE